MEITRANHLRYMTRLTPVLIVLYGIQAILYQRFAPPALASEVNIMMGVGLALIILAYQLYNHHHKITFHANYLEIRFNLLAIHEEILYRDIASVEVQNKKHYAHVVLHLKSDDKVKLMHIDSPELIQEFIEKKKTRN